MKAFWSNVIAGVLATIVGGAILTLILFTLDEWVFPKPNLTGEWIVTTVTKTSGYAPFVDLREVFKLELLQKGNELLGSGEKVMDTDKNEKITRYDPEKRVRLDISGYLESNYIRACKVNINIVEHGERAPSTNTFFLTYRSHDLLDGTYISTVSNCKGTVRLTRNSEKF